jgi:hypothetical protein
MPPIEKGWSRPQVAAIRYQSLWDGTPPLKLPYARVDLGHPALSLLIRPSEDGYRNCATTPVDEFGVAECWENFGQQLTNYSTNKASFAISAASIHRN